MFEATTGKPAVISGLFFILSVSCAWLSTEAHALPNDPPGEGAAPSPSTLVDPTYFSRDPYIRLGISPAADEREIRIAYWKRAQKIRLDKNAKAIAANPQLAHELKSAFANLYEAFQTLIDAGDRLTETPARTSRAPLPLELQVLLAMDARNRAAYFASVSRQVLQNHLITILSERGEKGLDSSYGLAQEMVEALNAVEFRRSGRITYVSDLVREAFWSKVYSGESRAWVTPNRLQQKLVRGSIRLLVKQGDRKAAKTLRDLRAMLRLMQSRYPDYAQDYRNFESLAESSFHEMVAQNPQLLDLGSKFGSIKSYCSAILNLPIHGL